MYKRQAYVFANPQELKRLEQILHPLVLEEMDKRVAASASGTIVVDCALLIEDVYKRQTIFRCTLLRQESGLAGSMVRITIQRRKANGCSGYRCTTNYHATISIM